MRSIVRLSPCIRRQLAAPKVIRPSFPEIIPRIAIGGCCYDPMIYERVEIDDVQTKTCVDGKSQVTGFLTYRDDKPNRTVCYTQVFFLKPERVRSSRRICMLSATLSMCGSRHPKKMSCYFAHMAVIFQRSFVYGFGREKIELRGSERRQPRISLETNT